MSKAQFEKAKGFIVQKRYGEARRILKQIDHPTARQWEAKLDAIQFDVPDEIPRKRNGSRRIYNATRGCVMLLIGIVVVGALLPGKPTGPGQSSLPTSTEATAIRAIAVQPTATTTQAQVTIIPTVAAPTATITETPVPSMTMVPNATVTPVRLSKPAEVLISDAIRTYTNANVLSVQIADGRDKGGERVAIVAYTTQIADTDSFVTELGHVLGAIAVTLDDYPIDLDSVSLIIGTSADQTVGAVAVAARDLRAVAQGEITGEELFTRIDFQTFTDFSAPSVATAPRSAPAAVQSYPDNCDEAVAMGLTAEQAGRYSHLDRDHDGVACYGD